MRPATILVVCAFLALGGAASATHSRPTCDANVTTIDAVVAAVYYVEGPESQTFLYLETNDHPGLQRGGSPWYEWLGGEFDFCWDVDIVTGEQIEDLDEIVL